MEESTTDYPIWRYVVSVVIFFGSLISCHCLVSLTCCYCSIAFTPDRQHVVVATASSAVYVLSVPEHNTVLKWETVGMSPRCVSTDGQRVLVSGDLGAVAWLPNWQAFAALPQAARKHKFEAGNDADFPLPRSISFTNNYVWCNKIIRGGFACGSLDSKMYVFRMRQR